VAETTTITDPAETLNELIQTCRKTEDGFRRATGAVNQIDLRRLFDTYAKQRARFASQLEVELLRMGGVLDRNGGLGRTGQTGKAHVRFPASDPSRIIDECTRFEDESVRGYRKALRAELPTPIQTIVERQIIAIVAANGRLHDLRTRHRTVA
jgi:uncharacterized protein (TIGR02284 family)